jgi:hypothetical protein
MTTVNRRRIALAGGILFAPLLCLPPLARAVDIPITGRKLVVVDKVASAGKAKAVFASKDPLVTKGTGTDPAQIEATLEIAYDTQYGAFLMPPGGHWLTNSPTGAKYVNKSAPTGGAVKVSAIKPTNLVKMVGKSLGDAPLSIASGPSAAVHVVDTIVNDGEVTRLCTTFNPCVHKVIAGGTGYKLVCKASLPDPTCQAGRAPLPGCGAAESPACDGVCPAGYSCLSFLSNDCNCAPQIDPFVGQCGELAGPPTCLGECPPSAPICADVAGVCTCLAQVTCGSSAFPQCNGICPVGEHCLSSLVGGEGCVCATSSECNSDASCGLDSIPLSCEVCISLGGVCNLDSCLFADLQCSSDCTCDDGTVCIFL